MKKLFLMLFMVVLVIQGCSRQTRDDIKQVGHDAAKDVSKTVDPDG